LIQGENLVDDSLLILGLGSEILCDDGLPLHLISDLKKELVHPGLVYRDANTGGLDLLDHLNGFPRAVIIDTIMTEGGTPGAVYTFTPQEDYRESLHLSSYHDATFPVTLQVGKKLGLDMPGEIWIIAIEIVESLEFGTSSSEHIQESYPQIFEKVSSTVNTIINKIVYSVL